MDFGREKGVFPLVLIQVKSETKRTVFGLKNKRKKAFLSFKTQLFHIQVVRYAATVIVLMAIFASLQTTFNQFLLPRIEAFLLRFSAFQTMKNHNDTVSAPEALTIEDSNQATLSVIDPAPIAEKTISEPSEYEVMRTNAIAEKNRATQTRLEKVISYTKQTMVAYMSEEDLNRLCTYIVEYSSGDTLQKISPVKVDSQLKSIDVMHFGWNIGKAFGRKRVHTATFIKNVFAHALRDIEISTIERKMSHAESKCKINLDSKIA